MKKYIVVFENGTMEFFAAEPSWHHFRADWKPRIFEVDGEVDIYTLLCWIAKGYKHSQFGEIYK